MSEVTLSTSVSCNTSLPPPSDSKDPPAGIGAFVTNSTSAFVSVSLVLVSTVIVAFTADPVTLPNIKPNTTVADADRVVFNDNGTMKQVAMTDIITYTDAGATALAIALG